jgi:beta-1,4-mannosyl-glycoprotein beta-1,4-N-acetylglucosaminyltransferase
MKIFDCFMYFDEDVVLDVRLNLLNEYVDYFVIVESKFNHKGEERKPLFNISKFKKFKEKIIYILDNKLPKNIEKTYKKDSEGTHYYKAISNASKRENFQRNNIIKGLQLANQNDWIIVSDLDEIPNLEKINFENIKSKFVFFKQNMMYYKFNLMLSNFTWVGSKACKFKDLKSPQWLRNIKGKKFNWWRVDVLFSKRKYFDIKFIEKGGWHYSYLKTPNGIKKKLKSYMHHIDYERNPINLKQIKNNILSKRAVYDLKVDQKENRLNAKNKLIKVRNSELPDYIIKNKKKFNKWIEK